MIMLLVFGLLPKQAQPCNGPWPKKLEGIVKHDKTQNKDEQEEMSRVREVNKTKTEGLSHFQKEITGFN